MSSVNLTAGHTHFGMEVVGWPGYLLSGSVRTRGAAECVTAIPEPVLGTSCASRTDNELSVSPSDFGHTRKRVRPSAQRSRLLPRVQRGAAAAPN